jgi:threonine dehydratase
VPFCTHAWQINSIGGVPGVVFGPGSIEQAHTADTCRAMKWLYDKHGLRTEPSGAIAVAAALFAKVNLMGDGDVVIVLSGRNVDETRFRQWIAVDE